MYKPTSEGGTKELYERFPFPGRRPIDRDGLIFLRHVSASITLQSGRRADSAVRVLDAGCGTGNTSVALARRFREAEFIGIDQSAASLEKACASARENNLTNVRFVQYDLMRPLPQDEPFDIILCLGVLHHLGDMKRGLFHLRQVLGKEGELYLWVYGKHGRYFHSLNMRCLQLLIGSGTTPDEAIRLAAEFVEKTNDGAPLRELIGKTPVEEIQKEAFGNPVWLADQFLNPCEELVDMEKLLDLFQDAQLELCETLGYSFDVTDYLQSQRLCERYFMLDERQQRVVSDLLVRPERYFVHLKPR